MLITHPSRLVAWLQHTNSTAIRNYCLREHGNRVSLPRTPVDQIRCVQLISFTRLPDYIKKFIALPLLFSICLNSLFNSTLIFGPGVCVDIRNSLRLQYPMLNMSLLLDCLTIQIKTSSRAYLLIAFLFLYVFISLGDFALPK